jgi:2-polyprenyl-3-methyl-5-hydroxy-6-metoxy-1,4-benzoquinol methylase
MSARDAVNVSDQSYEVDGAPGSTVLCLFDCDCPESVAAVIEGLSPAVSARLSEVLVVHESAVAWPGDQESAVANASSVPIKFHRNPRDYDYGDARKAAFEYVLAQGFSHVVCLRAGKRHPVELLGDLLDARDAYPRDLIIASRPRSGASGDSGTAPDATAQDRRMGTRLHERILKLGMTDYQSSYRIYPTAALDSLPYQLNEDDRRFDTELLIQCRGLGVGVREVPLARAWNEWDDAGERRTGVRQSAMAAFGYRLHQLHATRRGKYMIDHGIQYTLKHSATGSHMQIVDAITSDTQVLDLGCSQGLLARPLAAKSVRVTGVDVEPGGNLAIELTEYFQRDLEEPCELPVGRVFDYVVVADVIEHVKNRQQLIRSARRYLKEGGRLIISTGNIALWFYRLSLLVGRFEYGPRGILDRTHVHLYTRDTFRREVERAGFHILDEKVTSLPFEVVFESTGRSIWVQRLTGLYHWLAQRWPEMFAYQFILQAEIETLDHEATDSPLDSPQKDE